MVEDSVKAVGLFGEIKGNNILPPFEGGVAGVHDNQCIAKSDPGRGG